MIFAKPRMNAPTLPFIPKRTERLRHGPGERMACAAGKRLCLRESGETKVTVEFPVSGKIIKQLNKT